MVAFFSIVIAVALLGITVYGLHRYQTMEVEYNVDRTMPLPPLDAETEASDADEKKSTRAEIDSDAGDHAEAVSAGTNPQINNRQAAPESALSEKNNWLGQVATLKRSGDLKAALAVCQAEYPLWGAYNQACIVHRAQLKKSSSDNEEAERLLGKLYRLAATAELLHDKSPGAESLSPAQLKEMNIGSLEELAFPYREIGYAHLRLVRKSDIKLMQSLWGRPQQHQLPRQRHQQWWQEILAKS